MHVNSSLDLHRQSIYDNEQDLQDRFAMFWSKVSQHFSGNPYVLGYELINEPWAGDLYSHPDQAEPRTFHSCCYSIDIP